MTQEVKDTLKGMLVWTAVFTVVFAIAVLLIMKVYTGWNIDHTKVVLGFAVGGGLACFMAFHMAKSLSISVEMDEASALTYTKKKYLVRTLVVFGVMIALYFTGMFNILAMLGGLLCLKPATYVQMFFQKSEPVSEIQNTNTEEEEET